MFQLAALKGPSQLSVTSSQHSFEAFRVQSQGYETSPSQVAVKAAMVSRNQHVFLGWLNLSLEPFRTRLQCFQVSSQSRVSSLL